jgi:hypothetical protein
VLLPRVTTFRKYIEMQASAPLKESALLQILPNDDIRDGIKHEPDIVRIRGTCEMCIDFLKFRFLKSE